MRDPSEQPIGKGTTTLDYLKNAYPWLAEMLVDLEARAERAEAVVEAADNFYQFLHKVTGSSDDPEARFVMHGEDLEAEGVRERLSRLGEVLREVRQENSGINASDILSEEQKE